MAPVGFLFFFYVINRLMWSSVQVVSASGFPEISGNNLGGRIEIDDFTLSLKWSNIGNFHMYLIQVYSSFIGLSILSVLELETI